MALFRGFCAAILISAALPGWTAAQPDPSTNPARIVLAAGTKLDLVVINPVWAKTAKQGDDPLYSQTNFPVTAGGHIAIPAGAWVQGIIQSVVPPTAFRSRAEIQVLFSKIIFVNGYVLSLPALLPVAGTVTVANSPSAHSVPTVTKFTVEVNRRNDVLLDNGSQMEIALASPLELDAAKVTTAVPLTHAPEPGSFRSASRCRPTPSTPGTPATPDTVIPGTPGTPATVIPGAPGMPDTVIPGTPATPDAIIPGMPGTPGAAGSTCPPPPIVVSAAPVPTPATPNPRSTPPAH